MTVNAAVNGDEYKRMEEGKESSTAISVPSIAERVDVEAQIQPSYASEARWNRVCTCIDQVLCPVVAYGAMAAGGIAGIVLLFLSHKK